MWKCDANNRSGSLGILFLLCSRGVGVGLGQAQCSDVFVRPIPTSVFSGAPCSMLDSAERRPVENAMFHRHCYRVELRKVLSKYIRFYRYKSTLNAE